MMSILPLPTYRASACCNRIGPGAKIYTLTAPLLRIGRMSGQHIVTTILTSPDTYAECGKRGKIFPESFPQGINTLHAWIANPNGAHPLKMERRSGSGDFGPRNTVTFELLSKEYADRQSANSPEKQSMTIWPDQRHDIVLPAPTISRYHAEVEKIGQRYRVRDLRK